MNRLLPPGDQERRDERGGRRQEASEGGEMLQAPAISFLEHTHKHTHTAHPDPSATAAANNWAGSLFPFTAASAVLLLLGHERRLVPLFSQSSSLFSKWELNSKKSSHVSGAAAAATASPASSYSFRRFCSCPRILTHKKAEREEEAVEREGENEQWNSGKERNHQTLQL